MSKPQWCRIGDRLFERPAPGSIKIPARHPSGTTLRSLSRCCTCPMCQSSDVRCVSVAHQVTAGVCHACDAHFTIHVRQPRLGCRRMSDRSRPSSLRHTISRRRSVSFVCLTMRPSAATVRFHYESQHRTKSVAKATSPHFACQRPNADRSACRNKNSVNDETCWRANRVA